MQGCWEALHSHLSLFLRCSAWGDLSLCRGAAEGLWIWRNRLPSYRWDSRSLFHICLVGNHRVTPMKFGSMAQATLDKQEPLLLHIPTQIVQRHTRNRLKLGRAWAELWCLKYVPYYLRILAVPRRESLFWFLWITLLLMNFLTWQYCVGHTSGSFQGRNQNHQITDNEWMDGWTDGHWVVEAPVFGHLIEQAL